MIAANKQPKLVDQHGNPLKTNGHATARPQLLDSIHKVNGSGKRTRQVEGTYDASRDTDEFKNYWAHTDAYDADSAHSRRVRQTLVRRSRYEAGNNGYADGIASTYANDLVGIGPTLRMASGSEGFNRLVEREFLRWAKAVQFRRKLWCLAHAKHVDGEGIGVVRRNNRLRHPVRLDFVLHETEMLQTPFLPYEEDGYIDGIRFDEFGNPLWYDILKRHPGANGYSPLQGDVEQVAPEFVAHWYKMKRPGQHRGIPEMSSTLNLGAAARRWREATIAAAENIADFALFLKTTVDPDDMDAVEPMSTMEIQKRMMTALPMGWDPFQPRAEQPTAQHAEFNSSLITEQARPRNMPRNKAACDSSDYNYASGRLDHATYYASLNVDRADCEDLVLDVVFAVWFDRAITTYGWIGGNPEAIADTASNHSWDWPKHFVADIKSEAQVSKTELETGIKTLDDVLTEQGKDFSEHVAKEAAAHGWSPETYRTIQYIRNLPQHVLPYVVALLERGAMIPMPTSSGDDDAEE